MLRCIMLFLILILAITPIYAQDAGGNKTGLGIIYDFDSPYVTPPKSMEVIGVFKDSPAFNQLHLHDFITKVNGKDISSMTPDEYNNIDSIAQPVTLSITRNGNPMTVSLTPASYLQSTDTLVESYYKVGQFKGFETDDYFRSNLNSIDGVRAGDMFAIVSVDKVLGLAKVNDVNSDYSYLRVTRRFDKIDSAFQYKYSLVYVGYYPLTGHHFTEAEMKVLKENEQKQWKAQQDLAKAKASAPQVNVSPLQYVPAYDYYPPGYFYSPYRPYRPFPPFYPPGAPPVASPPNTNVISPIYSLPVTHGYSR